MFRNESPKKLAEKTAMLMPIPGKMTSQGACSMRLIFSEISLPQEGGGGTPSPKKLNVAWARNAVARSAEAYTSQGAMQFRAM